MSFFVFKWRECCHLLQIKPKLSAWVDTMNVFFILHFRQFFKFT